MLIISRIKTYTRLYAPHTMFVDSGSVECTNYPVNTDHVSWIQTDATVPCPGNVWKPAIVFHFVHKDSVTWAGYETEEQRDLAVQAIQMKMKSAEVSHL